MSRITRVIIEGARVFERLELDLGGLTVLIGRNGSGKSTVLECLQLLSACAQESFHSQLHLLHSAATGLLRQGAPLMALELHLEEENGQKAQYRLELRRSGPSLTLSKERLLLITPAQQNPLLVLERSEGRDRFFDQSARRLVLIPEEDRRPQQPLLTSFGLQPPNAAISRMIEALRGIEVQLPLYAIPNWAARSRQLPEGPRDGVPFLPTDRLGLLGWNLGAAWAELRNRETRHWEYTLDLLRLGLGGGLDTVFVQPGAGGQSIFLALKYHHLPEPLFAAQLSDGQLSWLAFVAMCRLGGRRSLLAVDEPERHLHPHLLHRVLDLLQQQGEQLPVLICTHDDRLLDMVEDPAREIRVCEQEGSRVRLRKLDPETLGPWLEEYGGVGSLRRAGHLPLALAEPEGEGS